MSFSCSCCGSSGGAGPFFQAQSLFVNSITGNDANNGLTATTAIKTLAELSRRLGGANLLPGPGPLTVDLVGDFPGQELVAVLDDANNQQVLFQAHATVVASGTVVAFTAAAAPATAASLQDAVIVWAARVGQQIVLTSGPNAGAVAWVLKDLGANTARVSQFINLATFTAVAPAPGETFDVRTVDTRIAGFHVVVPNGIATLVNFQVASDATPGRTSYIQCDGFFNLAQILGCKFTTNQFLFAEAVNCRLAGCCNDVTFNVGFSSIQVMGHAALGSWSVNQGRAFFLVVANFFQGNISLTTAFGGHVGQQILMGMFDRTAVGGVNIDIDVGAAYQADAALYGINNTNTGAAVRTRSKGTFVWTVQPTITSTGGDAQNGGAAITTWAAIAGAAQSSVLNANNGASIGLRS